MPHVTGTTVARPVAFLDPLAAFHALRGDGIAVLLDSAACGPDGGRYSYVAIDPAATIRAAWPDAFDQLEAWLERLPTVAAAAGWPFGGGVIGSFGYGLRHALEDLPSRHPCEAGPADLTLGLFDTILGFDMVERRAAILACDIDAARPSASRRIDALAARLTGIPELSPIDWQSRSAWVADWSETDYRRQVERVLDYIRAGDIYQANFTQRWIAPSPGDLDPFALYRRLRSLSPAPYAAFIDDGAGNAILSASPERFLLLSSDGRIDTRPIKGTRPRGDTEERDRANAAALTASAKDRAENLMIVDLLRNDLGRVALTGSVAVPTLNRLTSFASVHHLVSTVTAGLRPGLGPLDLIRATFPGGSVTGTPKIRAMEIIDEVEAAERGSYCGAIGWIGADRAMELSIAIRTITATPDRLIAQAGGGIVADSDPASEYDEALTKARPLLATVDPSYRNAAS